MPVNRCGYFHNPASTLERAQYQRDRCVKTNALAKLAFTQAIIKDRDEQHSPLPTAR
jgi:hypothetical protein